MTSGKPEAYMCTSHGYNWTCGFREHFFVYWSSRNRNCLLPSFKKMSVFAVEFSCINPARYLGSNCEAFSGGVDRHFKQLQKTDAKQLEWTIELL